MFTPVIVTVPVLEVAPAAILKAVFTLSVKSDTSAEESGVTLTVTSVASLEVWPSDAVTVAMPPASLIKVSDSDSVTAGGSSSSVISTSAPVTLMPATDVAPLTFTVSAGSSTSSWTGLRLKLPVRDRLFAAMVIVKPVTAVKSVPETAVPEATVTDTGVALSRAPPFSVAVTVITVALAASLTLSR